MPLSPRQNTFLAAPATPKHFFCPFCIAKNTSWSQPVTARQHLATAGHCLATTGHHLATPGHHLATPGNQNGRHSDQNCSLYIVAPPTKFKFPALFSAETRRIGPVPEINVPDTTPDHHRKFRGPRARQLKLVRIVTDRRTTTDRLQTTAGLSPCHMRVAIVRPPGRGGRSTFEWGGRPPQTPPLRKPRSAKILAPPKSLHRRTAIFDTSVPSLRSGTDKLWFRR